MVKRKSKQINSGQVIIPVGHPNPPELHEVDVAMVLAQHYQTTVEFIMPVDDYKRKTADIIMLGAEWEIKCPIGKSKHTIQEQFRRASQQAKRIIIDSRRTKLKYSFIEKSVRYELGKRPSVKRVILISKYGKVIEI